MVALRGQGNWKWEGPLGTPLGLVHWKRASSPVEAGRIAISPPVLQPQERWVKAPQAREAEEVSQTDGISRKVRGKNCHQIY